MVEVHEVVVSSVEGDTYNVLVDSDGNVYDCDNVPTTVAECLSEGFIIFEN